MPFAFRIFSGSRRKRVRLSAENAKKVKNDFFLYFLKNNRRAAVCHLRYRKIGNSSKKFHKRKMKEWFRLNRFVLDDSYDLWVSMKTDSIVAVPRRRKAFF